MAEKQNYTFHPGGFCKRAELDPALGELDAMREVWLALKPLKPPARARVLAWAAQNAERQDLASSITVDSPIEDLGLPTALLYRLENAEVTKVGQLTSMTKGDLWRVNGVGRVFIETTEDRLGTAGLSLAEESK